MIYIRRTFILALILTLSLLVAGALGEDAADRPTPMYWRDVTLRTARVNENVPQVNVRTGPGTEYERIGQLSSGETVLVTGRYNRDWYAVTLNGQRGYVAAEYVSVMEETDQAPAFEDDDIALQRDGVNIKYLYKVDEPVTLTGSLEVTGPILRASVSVVDLRAMQTLMDASVDYGPNDGRRSFDLDDFSSLMDLRSLGGGEKCLIVTAEGRNGSKVTVKRNFYVTGPYDITANMTRDCRLSGRYVDPDELYDGLQSTYWSIDEGTPLTIEMPEGRTGAVLELNWGTAPTPFTLSMFDGEGREIQTVDEGNGAKMRNFCYAFDERTRKIILRTAHSGKYLTEVHVIEKGKVSPQLMQWKPLPEKIDILAVSAHQDDELLFLGGTIPYYAAKGKTVAMCYMATCSRARLQEAMEGLWSCGLPYHPLFMGYKDAYSESIDEAQEIWGDGALRDLVEIIRRYKPEVVVTQDVNGEYGHMQHRLTSKLVREAVDCSWDESKYPESARTYGVWDVKKTYIHLYEDHQIHMDCYDDPLENRNGLSALQLATIGYAKHFSQHGQYQMENQGVQFDNKLFGLYRTTVGYDEVGGDFFENIP